MIQMVMCEGGNYLVNPTLILEVTNDLKQALHASLN